MAEVGKILTAIWTLVFYVSTVEAQKACPNATNAAEMCVFGIHTGSRIMIDMSTYSNTVPNCKCTFTTTASSLRLIPVTAPNNRRCSSAVRVNMASGNNLRFQCLVPGTVLDTSLYKDGSIEFEAYGSQYDTNYCMVLEHVGGKDDSVTVYCEGAAPTSISTLEPYTTPNAITTFETRTLPSDNTTKQGENRTADPVTVTGISDVHITNRVPTNAVVSSFNNITTVSTTGVTTTPEQNVYNNTVSSNSSVITNRPNITTPTHYEPTALLSPNTSQVTTSSNPTNMTENMVSVTTVPAGPLVASRHTTETYSTLESNTADFTSSNGSRTHAASFNFRASDSSSNDTNQEISILTESNPLSIDSNISDIVAIVDEIIMFKPPTTETASTSVDNNINSTMPYEPASQTNTKDMYTTASTTNVPMLRVEPVQNIANNDTLSIRSTTTIGTTKYIVTVQPTVMEGIDQFNTNEDVPPIENVNTYTASLSTEFQRSTSTSSVPVTQTGTVTTSTSRSPSTSLISGVNTTDTNTIPESTTKHRNIPLMLESLLSQVEILPVSTIPPARTFVKTKTTEINLQKDMHITSDNNYTVINTPNVTEKSLESTQAIPDNQNITDMERILRAVIHLLREEQPAESSRDQTTSTAHSNIDDILIKPTITPSDLQNKLHGIDVESITNAILTIAGKSPHSLLTSTTPRDIRLPQRNTTHVPSSLSQERTKTTHSNDTTSSISQSTVQPSAVNATVREEIVTVNGSTTFPVTNSFPPSATRLFSKYKSTTAANTVLQTSSTVLSRPTIPIDETGPSITTGTPSQPQSTDTDVVMPVSNSSGHIIISPTTVAPTLTTTAEVIMSIPVSITSVPKLNTEDILQHKLESLSNSKPSSGMGSKHTTLTVERMTVSTTDTAPVTVSQTANANASNVTKATQVKTKQNSYEVMVEDIVVTGGSPDDSAVPTDDPDSAQSADDPFIFNVDRHRLLAIIGGVAIFAILVAVVVMAINHSRKGRQMKATISGSMISNSTGPPSFRNHLFDNGAFEEIEKGVPSPLNTPRRIPADNRNVLRQAGNYSGDIGAL